MLKESGAGMSSGRIDNDISPGFSLKNPTILCQFKNREHRTIKTF